MFIINVERNFNLYYLETLTPQLVKIKNNEICDVKDYIYIIINYYVKIIYYNRYPKENQLRTLK